MYADRSLKCADCGVDFEFSASEQQFYEERAFRPPRRCKACRKSQKEAPGGASHRPARPPRSEGGDRHGTGAGGDIDSGGHHALQS